MVFREISKGEEGLRSISMATAPVKSQPLHNFSLPFLKWGKNQMNNHRCRKLVDSSRDSPPPDHRSSTSEAESEGTSASICKKDSEAEDRKYPIESRSSKNHFGFSSAASTTEKSLKNPTASEADAVGQEESKGKLLIRFRTSSKEESASKNKAAECGGEEVEESAPKPWNLRPRRTVFKSPIETGGASKNGYSLDDFPPMPHPEHLPKSLRLRGFVEVQNVEKKEKRQFSISLSREEIEEDIFALTGSKPSRRPKKRAKNIQKQLDNVFPGLWLADITADSYKVPDAPTKR